MNQLKENTPVKQDQIPLCTLVKNRKALCTNFLGISIGMVFLLAFFNLMGAPVWQEPLMICIFSVIYIVAVFPLAVAWRKLGFVRR